MTAASATGALASDAVLADAVRGRRSRLAAYKQRNLYVGGAIVLLIALVAILAPVIAPRGPQDTDYTARLQSPSREHIFGTDNLGKDTLSRVMHGARIDLQV